jgi:hypothetical protein
MKRNDIYLRMFATAIIVTEIEFNYPAECGVDRLFSGRPDVPVAARSR